MKEEKDQRIVPPNTEKGEKKKKHWDSIDLGVRVEEEEKKKSGRIPPSSTRGESMHPRRKSKKRRKRGTNRATQVGVKKKRSNFVFQ